MKRKREMEESEIRSAIDELSMLTSYKLKPVDNHDDVDDAHYIPTMVFISICNSVLQVLGSLLSLSLSRALTHTHALVIE